MNGEHSLDIFNPTNYQKLNVTDTFFQINQDFNCSIRSLTGCIQLL